MVAEKVTEIANFAKKIQSFWVKNVYTQLRKVFLHPNEIVLIYKSKCIYILSQRVFWHKWVCVDLFQWLLLFFRCTWRMDDDDFGGFEVCAVVYCLCNCFNFVIMKYTLENVLFIISMFFLIFLNVTLG